MGVKNCCLNRMVLRTCRVCGITANTEEELEVFKKHRKAKLGRDTICKECSNEQNRVKYPYSKYAGGYEDRIGTTGRKRLKLLEELCDPLTCYFCNKPVAVKLTVFHSLDRNHDNWNIENKVLAHTECHGKHHGANKVTD